MTRPPPPPERRGEGPPEPELPDPRPFRRIQALTAALLALGLIVALTSDRRPAEVRWGTVIGVALLALGVALVTRRSRPSTCRSRRRSSTCSRTCRTSST